MTFRKDVQVLRGVAVLLVVLFHLGVPGFGRGFLGVDVFFVISGYLMALMYDPADKPGFFAKRARRLLPAYFATVIGTLCAALVITTPNDFDQLASQGLFAAFFASNIGFWSETSYFHNAAFLPLLHLWSLGVEIQFYLFVPAIAWMVEKLRAPGYLVLTVGSALVCFAVVGISPKTSFFWMPLRLWQFMIGFGIARFAIDKRWEGRCQWMGSVGLVAICLVAMVFPIAGDRPSFLRGHPGAAALAISIATGLVLAAGLPSRVTVHPGARALEAFGNCSYSVYLAHFPVIVLALYSPFAGTVLASHSAGQFAFVVALVIVASGLLYAMVETPFRRPGLHPRSAGYAALAVVGIAASGTAIQNAFAAPAQRPIFAAWTDRAPYRCGKIYRILHPTARTCELTGLSAPRNTILLVGDSHADSIKKSFADVAAAAGTAVWFSVENNPLLPGGAGPASVVAEAARRGAREIVLHYTREGSKTAPIQALAELADTRGISVAVIMPVPEWPHHVPAMLWQSIRHGGPLDRQTLEEDTRSNAELTRMLAGIHVAHFKIYSVADLLCKPECMLKDPGGHVLYFDAHHLTLSGAALLRPVFEKVVGDAQAQEAPHLTVARPSHG